MDKAQDLKNMRILLLIIIAIPALYFGYDSIKIQYKINDLEEDIDKPYIDPAYGDLGDATLLELSSKFGRKESMKINSRMSHHNDKIMYKIQERSSLVYDRDENIGAIILLFIISVIIMLPLERWIFKAKATSTSIARNVRGVHEVGEVMGREKWATYSIADELQKWQKLRDDGIVSAEEFEQAKAKILGRVEKSQP